MSDMSSEYQALLNRLTSLREQRAVLEAEQKQKNAEREQLAEQLRAAGVDLSDLGQEKARLEREIQAIYAETQQKVDHFERRLRAARSGLSLGVSGEDEDSGDMEIL